MHRTWQHFRLDSVGTGGFSHDFGTLRGKHSTIAEVFNSLGKHKPTFFQSIMFLLSAVLPILARMPSPRRTLEKQFNSAAEKISRELLQKSRDEKVAAIASKGDNSVLGTLSMFNRLRKLYGGNADCILDANSSCFRWYFRAAYVWRRSHGSGEPDSISFLNKHSYQHYGAYRLKSSFLLAMKLHPVCISYWLLSTSINWLNEWMSTEVSLTVRRSFHRLSIHIRF
jgi:hypothetical protein